MRGTQTARQLRNLRAAEDDERHEQHDQKLRNTEIHTLSLRLQKPAATSTTVKTLRGNDVYLG